MSYGDTRDGIGRVSEDKISSLECYHMASDRSHLCHRRIKKQHLNSAQNQNEAKKLRQAQLIVNTSFQNIIHMAIY